MISYVNECQRTRQLQTQANECEKAIQEEFKRLHQFLWEEEKARLLKLRHEEEMKTKVMSEKLEHIQEQITKLASVIRDTETAIAAGDLPFLQVHAQPLLAHNTPFSSTRLSTDARFHFRSSAKGLQADKEKVRDDYLIQLS